MNSGGLNHRVWPHQHCHFPQPWVTTKYSGNLATTLASGSKSSWIMSVLNCWLHPFTVMPWFCTCSVLGSTVFRGNIEKLTRIQRDLRHLNVCPWLITVNDGYPIRHFAFYGRGIMGNRKEWPLVDWLIQRRWKFNNPWRSWRPTSCGTWPVHGCPWVTRGLPVGYPDSNRVLLYQTGFLQKMNEVHECGYPKPFLNTPILVQRFHRQAAQDHKAEPIIMQQATYFSDVCPTGASNHHVHVQNVGCR